MIAAHNEEDCIALSVESVLRQTRRPDHVLVIADNCTDLTVGRARAAGATVFESVNNVHRKSGALNQGWQLTRRHTDLYVCVDADTLLAPNALADWEQEFITSPTLAGCSAKFTMLTAPGMTRRERMWVRLQKAEFSKWSDTSLNRPGRRTSVLAGTACAISAHALEVLVRSISRSAPWTYDSLVEDFELTYRLRQLGYECRISTTVRAYTDAMTSLRTLWAQRLKWQVGTVQDLCKFGVNRLTLRDWGQQALGMVSVAIRLGWIGLILFAVLVTGHPHWLPYWWAIPATFAVCDLREAMRIPHRTLSDLVTAATLVPQEVFAWMRAAWFVVSWAEVATGRRRDRWAIQIATEGAK